MAEGKTLGTPGVTCECCEEADSSHFCCDCNQPLCNRCTKQHSRIASTKLHKPIPIEQYKSLASTTTTDSSKAYCAKHPSKTIEKLCEDCLVVVCSDCETDHKGHKLTHGSLDANILQRVSAQKIPGLVEIIQKLRDLDDGSPGKIKLYKEAEQLVILWKNELLDLLNRDADRLLKELHDEITKQETISAETSSKTQECIVKTDQHISKLSEAQKISISTKLLDRVSKCDKDIDDVNMYLEKMKVAQEKLKLQDILPYNDEFDRAKNTLKNLFSKIDQSKSHLTKHNTPGAGLKQGLAKPRVYDKLQIAHGRLLAFKSSPFYKICSRHDPNRLYVYQSYENKVQVFDKNLQKTASNRCSAAIFQIAPIANNRFMIIESSKKTVNLHDEQLNLLQTTLTPTDNYKPRGLCLIDANAVIMSEGNNKKSSTRFKEIRVNGDKINIKLLCEVATENWNGLMAYQDTGHLIYADTSNTFRRINLRTGKSAKFCETEANITSLSTDDENTALFGDVGGNIHKFENGKDPVTILEESGMVTGLLPTATGLVIAIGSKLVYYQFQ